jgi:thioredoxin-like negative regulator of GroEL
MIPTWNELANVEGINVGKVDCTVHKDLASKYEIRGFPTIILFKANGEQVKYSGAREVKAFTDFWNSNTQ